MSWRDLGAGSCGPSTWGSATRSPAGWRERRDHGGLVFIDLRDSTGVSQLVVNPERAPEAAAAAHEIRNEFVLQAEGEVAARAPENVNPDLPTGEVELQVDRLEIISRARRCRSSSTRRTSTRRCASATAGSTSGASGCSATSGSAPRWSRSSGARWRPRASSRSRRRSSSSRRPRARATSSSRRASRRAASSRCRSRRRSSSSCS